MESTVMAQVNWQEMGAMMVVIVAALGGQRGVEALIVAWRKPSGKVNGNGACRPVDEAKCTERMTYIETLHKERDDALLKGVGDLKTDVNRGMHELRTELTLGLTGVHKRVDDLFKKG